MTVLGAKHKLTASYHPQTNGLDERTNQTIQRYDKKEFLILNMLVAKS